MGSAFFDTGYRRGAGGAAAGKEGGVGYHALRLGVRAVPRAETEKKDDNHLIVK